MSWMAFHEEVVEVARHQAIQLLVLHFPQIQTHSLVGGKSSEALQFVEVVALGLLRNFLLLEEAEPLRGSLHALVGVELEAASFSPRQFLLGWTLRRA